MAQTFSFRNASVAASLSNLPSRNRETPRSVPHAAVFTLEKGADEIVHQPRLGGVMKQPVVDPPIDASSFGPNPERAIVVAEHVTNSDPLNAGNLISCSLAILETKEVCRSNPYPFAIFVHGFRVGVGCVRQCHGSHRSVAQSQHPRLGSHPDVFLKILKQIQNRIARQSCRSSYIRKSTRVVGKESMADGANP